MVKNKFKITAAAIILLGFIFAPYLVSADGWSVGSAPGNLPDTDLDEILFNIINWILGMAATLSILYLVWGGLNYLTAGGNEEQVESAKRIIKYALLGLFIVGVSYAAVKVVIDVFIKG